MPIIRERGFSLLELAVVLLITTLLAGGMLWPLTAQREQQQLNEARQSLEAIRDALLGYAVIHGSLPCPGTVSDPASAGYGEAAASCNGAPVAEGRLPWKTLGIAAADSWGGHWRYRVDRNFAGNAITLGTAFSADALNIRDGAGNTLTTTLERPLAIVYSSGKNLQPDGHNASFEASGGIYQGGDILPGFDDQLIWLLRPQLYQRLLAAGKLP